MNKDSIWFICLGVMLGFIAREQFNDKSLLFIFQLMQAIGAITIPILLFIWSKNSEKQKEKQQLKLYETKEKEKQELYEKQECINLLIPIFPNLSYSERKKLSAEEYKDILLDLYQKLHLCDHYLVFVSLSRYAYLRPYIQRCFMFLMSIERPLKDYTFYDSYHSICITYLKRDMHRYINQGYLDSDWQVRFINYRAYIDKHTKDTPNEQTN